MALDVIRAFGDLSPYINQCLYSYDQFSVNFQSIEKADLDRIWTYIQPDQVISLTLSDDDHTPGQIGLFLSRISIGQFVRLRYLHFMNADNFFAWHSVPAYLGKLIYLRSICLDFKRIRPDIYDESYSNLDYIFRTQTVTSLFLKNGSRSDIDFASLPIASHLRQFQIQLWRLDELPVVLSRVPNIHTLQLELQDKTLNNWKCLSLGRTTCQFVKRLLVKFKFGISVQQIKQFLESFQHRLIFLRVEIDNYQTKPEVIDATWWKALIVFCFPELKTFQFRVPLDTIEMENIEAILDRFREPFWCHEKGWLFSSDGISLHSTLLKASKQVVACFTPLNSNRFYRFSSVHTLELYSSYGTTSRVDLAELVFIQQSFIHDFSELVHLNCGTTYVSSKFIIELLRVAPRLTSLSIFDHERLRDILPDENTTIRYTQIDHLKIERDLNSADMEHVCLAFPHLQHVDIHMKSSEACNVIKLICSLKYLSSLVFVISDGRFIDRQDRCVTPSQIFTSRHSNLVSDWLRVNMNSYHYNYDLDGERVRLWIG